MPAISLLVIVSSVLNAAQTQQLASDTDSVASTVSALYQTISGPAGQKRDWDRMRNLFAEGGGMASILITRNGTVRRTPLTVSDYIAQSGPFLEERGFFEKEIARREERFGNIAHVWSTYESRAKESDEKPFARGINSIQLWNDGKRWWITSVVWQAEDGKNPLPEKYQKSGTSLRSRSN
jgi:hypothetical protein